MDQTMYQQHLKVGLCIGSQCVLVTRVYFYSYKRDIQTYMAVASRKQTKAVLHTRLTCTHFPTVGAITDSTTNVN